MKFRDLAAAAMTRKRLRLAPSSFDTDERRLRQVLPLMGEALIGAPDITVRVEEVLAQFKRDGKSGATVNRFLALISSVFKFGVDAGKLPTNPLAKKVKRFKEELTKFQQLRKDQEDKIRDVLVSDQHVWEFNLSINTGMRKGEQFFLHWDDVDFANRRLNVRGKTGLRPIVLNDIAIDALRNLYTMTGGKKYVCPDASDDVKRDWRPWFKKACEKAGVKNFTWHDLRHTFASRLAANRVAIVAVKELLGHKDIKTTMRYSHLAASHLDQAVETLVPKKEAE